MKIGDVLKKHFISLKEGVEKSDSFKKNDISCIGNKKDIALNLIKVIEDEVTPFDELPATAKKLIEKLHKFIKQNNK